EQGGCQFKLHTPLEGNGESGEIDLLAYNTSFPEEVLIVEVKAMLDTDEINEVHSATVEMQHGQKQVQKVMRILESMDNASRAQKFKFVRWDRAIKYYGLVVSPNSEPHQAYDQSLIPGIALSTLESRMRKNHFASPG